MSGPRFLVLGASGVIGSRLHAALGREHALATYCSTPVAGGVYFDAVTMRLGDVVPPRTDSITHAFLLHGITNIDACARDPARAHRVNVESTCRIIDELAVRRITPVFVSSDAVFDGSRGPWSEEDAVHPVLTYGRHKHEVEEYMRGKGGRWIVARLAKVVGTYTRGDMLTEWLDQLDADATIHCARDQVFSPVHIDDTVQALLNLARSECSGLYHVAGPTRLTRLELLHMLMNEAGRHRRTASRVIKCSLRDFDFAEPRPLDTSMSTAKLVAETGVVCRSMEAACADAVAVHYAAGGHRPGYVRAARA